MRRCLGLAAAQAGHSDMSEREVEAELWCARCQVYYAKIYRVQVRDGIWEHRREPAVVPKQCTICDDVIVRRA